MRDGGHDEYLGAVVLDEGRVSPLGVSERAGKPVARFVSYTRRKLVAKLRNLLGCNVWKECWPFLSVRAERGPRVFSQQVSHQILHHFIHPNRSG